MAMKLKGLDKLTEKIKSLRKLSEAYDKKNMQTLADISADRIKERTRNGYGATYTGGPAKKFKKLADSTKEARRKKRLHPDTSPTKSNLTESGKMTDAIYGKAKYREFEVSIKGSRNQDLAAIHNDIGAGKSGVTRPFMFLTGKDLEILGRKFRQILRNIIKKYKI